MKRNRISCILLVFLLLFAGFASQGRTIESAESMAVHESGKAQISQPDSIEEQSVSSAEELGNTYVIDRAAGAGSRHVERGMLTILLLFLTAIRLVQPGCMASHGFMPSQTFLESLHRILYYIHNKDGKKNRLSHDLERAVIN